MNRRETLKNLAIGAIGVGIAAEACKPGDKKPEATADKDALKGINIDRMEAEKVYEQSLIDQGKFFTEAEMATITILANIIIPKDDVSGSATDAGVPEFINFIVLDMPHHQVPMRGGLRWLDMQCLSRFGKDFSSCSKATANGNGRCHRIAGESQTRNGTRSFLLQPYAQFNRHRFLYLRNWV